MTSTDFGKLALHVRIALIRVGVIPGLITILLLVGTATWIFFAFHAHDQGQKERSLVQARERLRTPTVADDIAPELAAEKNLHKFYDALGDRTEVEKYLNTLFAIADRTELSLNQGEYVWQFDKNNSTYRYQILLPVKGSYGVIRRFCEKTLLALPFASLDELSFKRESVGQEAIDANLRFTFYLKDVFRAPQEAGVVK